MVGSSWAAVIAKAMNAAVPRMNAAGLPLVAVEATPRARLMQEAVATATARMVFSFIFRSRMCRAIFYFPVSLDRGGPWLARLEMNI